MDLPGGFREMSALAPDTVIEGTAYVVWIKETAGYADPDTIYGVVIKGNSRFGHSDFSYVCQTLNKKVFFCKKINDGRSDTTWQMCMDAMKVEKPPRGTPILLTARPYTFAEVATIAYEEKFFTDPDGPKHIAERTAPPSSSKLKIPAQKEPAVDPPELLADSHNKGDILKLDEEDEELDEDLVNMEERAALAESKASALMQERELLERKLAEVTAKYESSMNHQKEFMIRADNATMTVEAMNDNTADKVVKALYPKFSALPSLNTNVGNVLAKVVEIGNAVNSIPLILKKADEILSQVSGVGSLVNSARDSLSEGLSTIEDTMASYGMAEDEEKLDIPSSIKTLVETAQRSVEAGDGDVAGAVPAPDQEQKSSLCYYLSHHVAATFICKCGCGHEVQFEPTGPSIGSGSSHTTQQGFLAPPVPSLSTPVLSYASPVNSTTPGSDPIQPATYIVPSGPKGYQYSPVTAPYLPPESATPAPGTAPAPGTTSSSVPGSSDRVSDSRDASDQVDGTRVTRKEKRKARTEAYKQEKAAKKLDFGQSGNQVHGDGVGGERGRGRGVRANLGPRFDYNGPRPRFMPPGNAMLRHPTTPRLPNRGSGILQRPVWLYQTEQNKQF